MSRQLMFSTGAPSQNALKHSQKAGKGGQGIIYNSQPNEVTSPLSFRGAVGTTGSLSKLL